MASAAPCPPASPIVRSPDSCISASSTETGSWTRTPQDSACDHQCEPRDATISETLKVEDGTRRKIAKWLRAPDPWIDHENARPRTAVSKAGSWLLQSDAYKSWKSEGGHCWLSGKPGCGKTALCSTVIEDLRREHSQRLAIFYFSFARSDSQTYEGLLRSLVVQLALDEPVLRQAYHGRSVVAVSELERLVISATTKPSVRLIIDALDECSELDRSALLDVLERLMQNTSLRLFVLSRDIPDIRNALLKVPDIRHIAVTSSVVDEDIRQWLTSQLSRDARLTRLRADLKDEIQSEISNRANGMFQFAVLQLQELSSIPVTRPSFVRNALAALPSTVEKIYERILGNIRPDCRQTALKLLRWLAYAKRPLKLTELMDIVLIEADTGTVMLDDRGHIDDALNILTGLIERVEDKTTHELDEQTELASQAGLDPPRWETCNSTSTSVRLAHLSVKEYLESLGDCGNLTVRFCLHSQRDHLRITQDCLTYLTHYSSDFHKTLSRQDYSSYPLLRYAAEAWSWHSMRHDQSSVELEVQFLQDESILRDWLLIDPPDMAGVGHFVETSPRIDSDIYYASVLGLSSVVHSLLYEGADLHAEGYLGTPLQAAATRGHTRVVELLLAASANVHASSHDHRSALQSASKHGHEDVVRVLITADADPNAYGNYEPALHSAAFVGHTGVITQLLDAGAEINATSPSHGTALQIACARGHHQVVTLLLASNANVNTQGGYYGTALHAAAIEGHARIVQTLLTAKANVQVLDKNRDTALAAATRAGQCSVVKELLGNFPTQASAARALVCAVRQGDEDMVQLLVRAGADMQFEVERGNALIWAVIRDHQAVVEILLASGANVNADTGRGTPLMCAAWRGYAKLVRMLLANGASVNKHSHRRTALTQAAEKGNSMVTLLLLGAGADVNAQTSRGTALALARANGHSVTSQLLLDHGALCVVDDHTSAGSPRAGSPDLPW